MSVTLRRFRRGGWEVDIRLVWPDGRKMRVRKKAPVSSHGSALRWGQAKEQELFSRGLEKPRREAPTLHEFAPRFIEVYARANRQKPSGVAAKEMILRVHLLPAIGGKKLDAIGNEDVQRLKRQLEKKAPKTANNVLTVLGRLLRVAVEWEVIEKMPCSIRLLPVPPRQAAFHDFEAFERLVTAARRLDPQGHLVVLLGGEAGLRCGEMRALEWRDVDLEKRQLKVERSDWLGVVGSPKGGRLRYVPMTSRLEAALRAHRHLRGARVLCMTDGSPLTEKMVRLVVERAARVANVGNSTVHVLRHSFCSHLAMRGAPVGAIKELAGHADISTTQRYMHLSPAAIEGAIRLLDRPEGVSPRGDIVETAPGGSRNPSGASDISGGRQGIRTLDIIGGRAA
ncbi:MAG: tyrosine-type recombinase/integrase [Acidobacteriota bacterium]